MTDDNAFPDFNSAAQSERDFVMALKSLILEPEQVNLNQLWQVIEQLLQQLPDLEQLHIGGTVMILNESIAQSSYRLCSQASREEASAKDGDILPTLLLRDSASFSPSRSPLSIFE